MTDLRNPKAPGWFLVRALCILTDDVYGPFYQFPRMDWSKTDDELANELTKYRVGVMEDEWYEGATGMAIIERSNKILSAYRRGGIHEMLVRWCTPSPYKCPYHDAVSYFTAGVAIQRGSPSDITPSSVHALVGNILWDKEHESSQANVPKMRKVHEEYEKERAKHADDPMWVLRPREVGTGVIDGAMERQT